MTVFCFYKIRNRLVQHNTTLPFSLTTGQRYVCGSAEVKVGCFNKRFIDMKLNCKQGRWCLVVRLRDVCRWRKDMKAQAKLNDLDLNWTIFVYKLPGVTHHRLLIQWLVVSASLAKRNEASLLLLIVSVQLSSSYLFKTYKYTLQSWPRLICWSLCARR